jgi:hypothetical protein
MRVLGSFVLAISLLGCVAADSEDPDVEGGIHDDHFSECFRYNGPCIPTLLGTPDGDSPPTTTPPYVGDDDPFHPRGTEDPPPPPQEEDPPPPQEEDPPPPEEEDPPPVDDPCDLNGDGDTTDHGECDHVCHDGE